MGEPLRGFGFNSLNGAINIEGNIFGEWLTLGFNSLNGAINIGCKFR